MNSRLDFNLALILVKMSFVLMIPNKCKLLKNTGEHNLFSLNFAVAGSWIMLCVNIAAKDGGPSSLPY